MCFSKYWNLSFSTLPERWIDCFKGSRWRNTREFQLGYPRRRTCVWAACDEFNSWEARNLITLVGRRQCRTQSTYFRPWSRICIIYEPLIWGRKEDRWIFESTRFVGPGPIFRLYVVKPVIFLLVWHDTDWNRLSATQPQNATWIIERKEVPLVDDSCDFVSYFLVYIQYLFRDMCLIVSLWKLE